MALTCVLALTAGAAWADTPELKTGPAPFAVKVEIKPTAAPQEETKPAQPAVTAKKDTKSQTAAKEGQQAKAAESEKKIGINLASRILTLYEGDTKVKMYHVGVGKTSTPTPTGYYAVQYKEVNPTWVTRMTRASKSVQVRITLLATAGSAFTVTMESMGPIILNPSAAMCPMAAYA